jgi:hypothetical protein
VLELYPLHFSRLPGDIFNNLVLNIAIFVGNITQNLKQKPIELLYVPVFVEKARQTDIDNTVINTCNAAFLEPGIEIGSRNGEFDLRKDIFPQFMWIRTVDRLDCGAFIGNRLLNESQTNQ